MYWMRFLYNVEILGVYTCGFEDHGTTVVTNWKTSHVISLNKCTFKMDKREGDIYLN